MSNLASWIAVPTSLIALAGSARGAPYWTASYDSAGLANWSTIQCGGPDGSCPCVDCYSLGPARCQSCPCPTPPPKYQSGQCNVNTQGSANGLTSGTEPPGSRFLVVPDPSGQPGNVLRVQLAYGDCGYDGDASGTTRNELAYPVLPGGGLDFHAGDTYYFRFSIYFDPSFAQYSCAPSNGCTGAADGSCPQNPWFSITDLHAEDGSGGSPGYLNMGFGLRQVPGGGQQYQLVFNQYSPAGGACNPTASTPCSINAGDQPLVNFWTVPAPIATGTWYDLLWLVHFEPSTAGWVKLWFGQNGGGLTQQAFNPAACLGGVGSDGSCYTPTLDWNTGAEYLKQGLYRNGSLADAVTAYYKDTSICTANDGADCGLGAAPPPPATDAGAPAPDAGTPAADAGTPATDAGTPATDAGTPAADAGTPATDAGTPAADAGTPAAREGTLRYAPPHMWHPILLWRLFQ